MFRFFRRTVVEQLIEGDVNKNQDDTAADTAR